MSDVMEKISLVMDNEHESHEEKLIINALKQNNELRSTWYRYHYIRQIIQSENIDYPDPLLKKILSKSNKTDVVSTDS